MRNYANTHIVHVRYVQYFVILNVFFLQALSYLFSGVALLYTFLDVWVKCKTNFYNYMYII